MDYDSPVVAIERKRAEQLVAYERQSYKRTIAEVQGVCSSIEKYFKGIPVWNIREKYYDWYTGYTMARMLGRIESSLAVLSQMDHADVRDLYDELELMLLSARNQYLFMLNRMVERQVEQREKEKQA